MQGISFVPCTWIRLLSFQIVPRPRTTRRIRSPLRMLARQRVFLGLSLLKQVELQPHRGICS
jgi:hypothetical protein